MMFAPLIPNKMTKETIITALKDSAIAQHNTETNQTSYLIYESEFEHAAERIMKEFSAYQATSEETLAALIKARLEIFELQQANRKLFVSVTADKDAPKEALTELIEKGLEQLKTKP